MSLDARAPRRPFALPRFRGGTAQILALVLLALLIVFFEFGSQSLHTLNGSHSAALQENGAA